MIRGKKINKSLTNFTNLNLKLDRNIKLNIDFNFYNMKIKNYINYEYYYRCILNDNIIDVNEIDFFNKTHFIFEEGTNLNMNNKMMKNLVEYRILVVQNDIGKIMTDFNKAHGMQKSSFCTSPTSFHSCI